MNKGDNITKGNANMKTLLIVDHLKAVFNAVSNEETRRYLCGVQVEINEKGTTLVATNGQMLLAAHDETNTLNEPVKLIIPDHIVKGLKFMLGQDLVDLSTDDGKTWRLGNTLFQPVDGTYPDWRRVVPQETPLLISIEGIWYDPKFQIAMAKAAKILSATWTIYPNGTTPALVRFEKAKNIDVIGVISPMKKNRESFKKPSWA